MRNSTEAMMPEITCHKCGKAITTFAIWFSETCEADGATGHVLDWLQIMALQWRPVAQADQKVQGEP